MTNEQDDTQQLLKLLFPPKLEDLAREGENPIQSFDIIVMGVKGSGKSELAYKLGEIAINQYGVEKVNLIQTGMEKLYVGMNEKSLQVQFVDDATFVKPSRAVLERWKQARHLGKQAGMPNYGRILTIFSTHELVRLNRDLRATILPINIYKTIPVGEYDEPRMKRRLGEDNVNLLYEIGKAIMIGGAAASAMQQYSVVEIPHIKNVFRIKLERGKNMFRQIGLEDTLSLGIEMRVCKKCYQTFTCNKSSEHRLCADCLGGK